jgi:hypothetical protein
MGSLTRNARQLQPSTGRLARWHLASVDVTLTDEILDRIDEVGPPGTTA